MSGLVRKLRPRALPWGFLGMLALVWNVETYVARHDLDFLPWSNWSWRLAAHAASKHAPKAEVLCFGDSLVKFGLLPQVIETQSHRSSYNLAIAAVQPAGCYYLLRRALESGAHPAAVVIDFLPSSLCGGHDGNADQFVELRSWRDFLDEAWTARDPRFLAHTAVRWWLPSYKDRWEIRDDITAALAGKSAARRMRNLSLLEHWVLSRGAQVEMRNPALVHDAAQLARIIHENRLTIISENWQCDGVNRLFITRFLALAQSRGIPVFWLLPPAIAGIQHERERNGSDARFERVVVDLHRRFPNLVVVDGRHAGYPADVFSDAIHLDRRGAAVLSTDVAGIIDGYLASAPGRRPRWCALPAYHDDPLDAGLQDRLQTAMALRLRELQSGARR